MKLLRVQGILIAAALGLSMACTVHRDPPNLVGQDIRITVIHTSDIHSRLFPYTFVPNRFDQGYGLLPENGPFGGVARMATIVKRERAKANRSIWLDSGDCFQGAPVFNMFKGEAEIRALSAAGMDGAVIGNHEFDLGSQNLFEQIDNWAEFPMIAANYVWDDPPNPDRRSLKDIVPPYVVYDIDGVKLAVIGMANWSSMTGILEGGNSLGLRPLDERQVVEEYVRLLRPSVDVIVLLSHLGLDEDEGLGANQVDDMNEDLPLEGVDLVLGGHLHIVLNPPKVIPNDEYGNQAVLVHSGAFAKYVGRLDMVVHIGEDNSDPTKRSRITAFSYNNIPIDSKIEPDPEITELLAPYSIALNAAIDLDGVFAYVYTDEATNQTGDTKVIRNHLSGGDSQLGNLVARSMQLRPGVEAELAITNSLGIRADFEKGPLTIEQMFNVFPFENSITIIYLSGSEIAETLDFVARKSADRGCRTQAQVAGIAFDMVCGGDCPNGARACAKNIYIGDNCRGDNPEGPIDQTKCAPIEPTGLYRVAVNDYIARGGSGFEVLKRNTSKQDTGISLRDALIDFLRQQPRCPEGIKDVSDPNPVVADKKTVQERWGDIACIDSTVEAHDGRIRAVFE
jgi:2',3'-cyclic-nucleotide 2'-phosphodiesterase (5'-nucleotidase family)